MTEFFSQHIISIDANEEQRSSGRDDARLFGSTSRPRILSLLLSHPQQAFYQREVMYGTGLSLQTVQRELENLIRLGILKKRETKARVYYQINTTSSWFRPLKEIYESVGRE